MNQELQRIDLRQAPRRRTLLGGVIVSEDRSASLSCTVRDLSDTGARLEIERQAEIPPAFDLYLPKRQQAVRCEAVWRRDQWMGVRFLSARPCGLTEGQITATMARIHSLLREVGQLRTLLG